MEDVIALILGGGRGTRLFPLTQHRAKPAVPIGGKYRLVDVAVSNCLHARLRRIFVLTQYQSESLNAHVANTYKFDAFSPGFVQILAAEQTEDNTDWFLGTADAVRQSLRHIRRERWREVVILGGDQLYRMSLLEMLKTHRQSGAKATVAMKPVGAEETAAFGIMKVNPSGRVTHFEEKPRAERLPALASALPSQPAPTYLASMGIYVFDRNTLEEALSDEKALDFGGQVIPALLPRTRVQAHLYHGYWADVGTIRSYYEANLALTRAQPPFNFYDARHPIYTHPRFLTPTKMLSSRVHESLIADGCYIDEADIERSVIGIRSRVARGAQIRRSLLLGADVYETPEEMEAATRRGVPLLGVGEGSVIEGAILDKNVRVGKNVRLRNERGLREHDGEGYYIREGLVIVPKNGVVPDGTVI
jgi:glucose-1-phosphate adenylyltransferase